MSRYDTSLDMSLEEARRLEALRLALQFATSGHMEFKNSSVVKKAKEFEDFLKGTSSQ